MCKGGSSGTNTVVQNSQPPSNVMAAYDALLSRGNTTANQPLQQYGGPMVAGFNPEQQAGFSAVNAGANAGAPYNALAGDYAALGAAPVAGNIPQFSAANVGQYESPYTSDVINSTVATMDEQNQVQQNQLLGQAIGAGNAFGGDRAGVAQGQLALSQDLAKNQTVAGLENQGYSQALGEFNTQQQTSLNAQEGDAWREANAGYQFSGLGAQAQNQALTGANAMLGAGGMQQQLQQENLNIPYEQFLQQQSYPFQTTNFLAGLTEGIGSGSGGSSSTTSPGPSPISQVAGLATTGLGLFGAANSAGLFGLGAGAAGLDSALGVPIAGEAADLSGLAGSAGLDLLGGLKRGGRIDGYDDGGAVASNPGGVAPAMIGSNPQTQQLWGQYSQMTAEQLQELAVRYQPTTPQGQLVRKALQQKQMAPSSTAPSVGATPTPATSGSALGAGEYQSAPMSLTAAGSGANVGYADGGPTTDPTMPPMSEDADGMTNPNVTDAYFGSTGHAAPYPKLPTVAKIGSPVGGDQASVVPKSEGAAPMSRGLGIPQPPPSLGSSPDGGDAGGLGAGDGAPVADTGAGATSDPLSDPAKFRSDSGENSFALSPWLPVAEAGFGMMAGTSPFAGVNIGRGGLAGVQGLEEQTKLRSAMRLQGAQAENEQTQADMNRLFFNAQKLAMEGKGPDGSPLSTDTGGGGDTGAGANGTGGGAAGAPTTTFDMNKIAPNYARDMQMAKWWGMRGPAGATNAETWRTQALNEADYLHAQPLLKAGAVMDEQGAWSLPKDVASTLGAVSGTAATTLHAGDIRLVNGVPTMGQPNAVEWTGDDGKQHTSMIVITPQMIGTDGNVDPASLKAAVSSGATTPQPAASASTTPPATMRGEAFVKQYKPLLDQTETANKLPKNILSAQLWEESNANPLAISPKGAEGVLQFMPATAAQNGVDPWKPDSAIPGAGKLMSQYLQNRKGNTLYALADYNWGQGHVDNWLKTTGGDFSKLPAETQKYVFDVMNHMQTGFEVPGAGAAQPQPAAGGAPAPTVDPNAPQRDAQGNLTYTSKNPAGAAEAGALGTGYGDLAGEYRKNSQLAFDTNNTVDRMLDEAKHFRMGPGANVEGEMRTWMSAMFPDVGSITDPQAAWAAFNKNSNGLVRQATRQLSARAAVQEMLMVQKSLPSATMTPQAFRNIAYQIKGSNDYAMALDRYYGSGQWSGSLKGYEPWFQQQAGPAAFMVHEMDPGTRAAFIKSNQGTPQGRAMLRSLATQSKFIDDNNLMPIQ